MDNSELIQLIFFLAQSILLIMIFGKIFFIMDHINEFMRHVTINVGRIEEEQSDNDDDGYHHIQHRVTWCMEPIQYIVDDDTRSKCVHK